MKYSSTRTLGATEYISSEQMKQMKSCNKKNNKKI